MPILMILRILYTLLTKQVTLRKQNILENTKPNLKMMEKISSTFLTCTLLKKHIIIFCTALHTCQTNYIFIGFSNKSRCNKWFFCRCIATQVDRDGRTILYTRTETIKLHVEKLIIPPPVSLTQKIGIISAVLLAIIFLILCCVFCLFAICKKRRRQKRSR